MSAQLCLWQGGKMDIKIEYGKLIVDGVVQSIYPPLDRGYWKEMVPDFEPKNVLMLGVGAGTTAKLLKDRFPGVIIYGVDNNLEIYKKIKLENVDFMMWADAFHVISGQHPHLFETTQFDHFETTQFDLIIIDIWNGGWWNAKVIQKEFLDQCKKLLTPKGKVYINVPNIEDMVAVVGLKQKAKVEGNAIYET